MRDPETMAVALAAAETGHLVLATVHATDAAAAISRIADGFPVERQNAVRQELAMALAAVLTQSLVQTRSGTLAPAAELLVVSYGARQHIRKNALQAPQPGDHPSRGRRGLSRWRNRSRAWCTVAASIAETRCCALRIRRSSSHSCGAPEVFFIARFAARVTAVVATIVAISPTTSST
jgi:hypothetical protein